MLSGSGTLLIRRGKTDPGGDGALLYLAPDSIKLVREWLARSGLTGGRLFRSLRKDGRLGEKLDASQVPRIYKAMAKADGLAVWSMQQAEIGLFKRRWDRD